MTRESLKSLVRRSARSYEFKRLGDLELMRDDEGTKARQSYTLRPRLAQIRHEIIICCFGFFEPLDARFLCACHSGEFLQD